MVIQKNPFTSQLFTEKWCNHFNDNKPSIRVDTIKDLEFIPFKYLPNVYYNVGKYKTCGISYEVSKMADTHEDTKNKVFLIYDIPEYYKLDSKPNHSLGIKKIKQYDGFLTELEQFNNISDYLTKHFNSKRRHAIKSGMKKLEKDHDISYEWYFGPIERETFNFIFENLYTLIENKFENKKESNSHAKKEIKDWYNDLIFEMINRKEASFFVIYNAQNPIAIALNYHADNILYGAIPATDIRYAKYGIGSVIVLKSIEWALDNGYSFFDLSKGSYGYKHRWASKKYHFEYHILYDKKSIMASITALGLDTFYRAKQFLRDKKAKYLSKLTKLEV